MASRCSCPGSFLPVIEPTSDKVPVIGLIVAQDVLSEGFLLNTPRRSATNNPPATQGIAAPTHIPAVEVVPAMPAIDAVPVTPSFAPAAIPAPNSPRTDAAEAIPRELAAFPATPTADARLPAVLPEKTLHRLLADCAAPIIPDVP